MNSLYSIYPSKIERRIGITTLLVMKEIILYSIAAVSSLVVLGYSIHMFVGGLVSPVTERYLIAGACAIGLVIIALMYWDVARRRR